MGQTISRMLQMGLVTALSFNTVELTIPGVAEGLVGGVSINVRSTFAKDNDQKLGAGREKVILGIWIQKEIIGLKNIVTNKCNGILMCPGSSSQTNEADQTSEKTDVDGTDDERFIRFCFCEADNERGGVDKGSEGRV